MAIRVQGELDGSVSQPLLDDLGVGVGKQQVRCMAVPEVVQADPLEEHSLAARPEHRETLARLRLRWGQLRKELE